MLIEIETNGGCVVKRFYELVFIETCLGARVRVLYLSIFPTVIFRTQGQSFKNSESYSE